ncbi:hypothetical protein M3Y99_01432900 [Aphelenchoides fujianensis]|nr:hypothetical protein M3Y99_01432900 [Aphelenchoides fujianensis]
MSYAIDAVQEISESTFRCLAKMNVSLYFARIWSSANNGEADKMGAKNISVGYYTNWYDWSLIMGNAKPFEEYAPLWYWRVNGFGTRGATAHNIDDFVPFGPFKIPNIKQFVWEEEHCGTKVNASLYSKP